MDYEKKYNEALERLQALHRDYDNISNLVDVKRELESIFPELRESEDERIRKWLLECVENLSDGNFIEVSKQDVLFYLEKQKEQKPDIEICPHSIKSKSYKENGYPTDDKAFEEWIDGWFKEHKEKAYPQITMDEKEFKNFCRGIRNMYQRKPAWSEVELLFRGEKVTVKRPFYRDDKGRGYSTAELDEGVAWSALRAWCEKKGISLYDLYPKAEWSEEDEKMLTGIIARGSSQVPPYDPALREEQIEWLMNRLKSLRPSWKPGEEQMEVLLNAEGLVRANNYNENAKILASLYEDLKRL